MTDPTYDRVIRELQHSKSLSQLKTAKRYAGLFLVDLATKTDEGVVDLVRQRIEKVYKEQLAHHE